MTLQFSQIWNSVWRCNLSMTVAMLAMMVSMRPIWLRPAGPAPQVETMKDYWMHWVQAVLPSLPCALPRQPAARAR